MNTTPKPTRRGGARIGAGRRKVGRRSIVVRIKAEILEKLSPNAARLISELVEDQLQNEQKNNADNALLPCNQGKFESTANVLPIEQLSGKVLVKSTQKPGV